MLPDTDLSRLTIAEILALRAEHQPDQVAIYVERQTQAKDWQSQYRPITYVQLHSQAIAVAAELGQLSRPTAGENRVVIAQPPGLELVASFFGCLYAGAIAVPIQPPRGPENRSNVDGERWQQVFLDSDPSAVLTSAELLSRVQESAPPATPILVTDQPQPSEKQANWQDVSASIAFLQYTSGSTGTPRGVVVTHANLTHNLEQIRCRFGHTNTSRGVIWLPPYHDMGLIGGILQPIYAGFPVLLMSPLSMIRNPFRWLEAISNFRATTSGGPNFAYQYAVDKISPEKCNNLDLSSWDVAFVGAEPVRMNTLRRFAEKFSPYGFRESSFLPCYGLAEATLMVSGRSGLKFSTSDDRQQQKSNSSLGPQLQQNAIVSCGQAANGVNVRIVAPETQLPCSSGTIGEVWITGPSVARGYWNREQESLATFQAKLNLPSDNSTDHLRTGDLGFLRDGELFLCGRMKDLIVIRGQNYFPTDLEQCIEASRATSAENCTAAFSVDDGDAEHLIVVQEVPRSLQEQSAIETVASEIRASISASFALNVHEFVAVKSGSLPRTSSGKIKRFACKQAYQTGSFKLVGGSVGTFQKIEQEETEKTEAEYFNSPLPLITPVQKTEIHNWLIAELSAKLKVEPAEISASRPLAELGVDSVAAVEIAEALSSKLQLEQPLDPTIAWQYPTIDALCAFVAERCSMGREEMEQEGIEQEATEKTEGRRLASPLPLFAPVQKDQSEPIAVVGISCRFPGGANSPQAFWRLLREGTDAATEIPADRWDVDAYFDPDPESIGKMYTRVGALVDDVFDFDPEFFGISPREALALDPQQRLLLEGCYLALGDADHSPSALRGSNTGVYVSLGPDDYAQRHRHLGDLSFVNQHSSLGAMRGVAAGRVSYVFDFNGPTMQVDTTCSSSLVATHLACQALRNGEADLMLAGGVNLILSPESMVACCKLRALSPDGRCATFANQANGYLRGEGCGIVVLQRLSDAVAQQRPIYAVLRGSAVNHDGLSNGLTAPNGKSQVAVMQQALDRARLAAKQIDYVEAHGTGTPLGDPIEVQAIDTVYGKRPAPLPVGSVKTNIGHLESAAGIASLIKVVLAMQQAHVPQHLHCSKLSEKIDWQKLAVKVATTGSDWPLATAPRRAGVSSFGMSGTNAHVIVEQPVGVPLRESWSEPVDVPKRDIPFKRKRYCLQIPKIEQEETGSTEQSHSNAPFPLLPPVQKFTHDTNSGSNTDNNESNLQLVVTTPGSLEGLTWRRRQRRKPQTGEVELRVLEVGLNFRDVLVAMGLYPDQAELGCECVGIVTALGPETQGLQIGDHVLAIAAGCLADYVTTARSLVIPLGSLKQTSAAALPVAYATASYSLLTLANLKRGESVLIHAATGGVGQAAISVAHSVDAQVYATASREKWPTLRELGVQQPMDSRSLAFAEQLMAATGGRGVDVVLNSLPGEARRKSVEVLAKLGRFVEIGKGEGPKPAELLAAGPSAKHYLFDLSKLCADKPEQVQRLLQELVKQVGCGNWRGLPTSVFQRSDFLKPLRAMQGAKHIGKLVVRMTPTNGQAEEANKQQVPTASGQETSLAADHILTNTNSIPTSFGELENYVCGRVSRVLGFEPDGLDRNKGFFDLGLDSLTALELKNSIQRELGIELPSTVALDYPNTNAMLGYLADKLQIDQDAPDIGSQLDQKLAEIDKLFA